MDIIIQRGLVLLFHFLWRFMSWECYDDQLILTMTNSWVSQQYSCAIVEFSKYDFQSLEFSKVLSFLSLEFSKPACNELAAQKRRLASSRQSQRQIPRHFERRQNLASTRTWFQSKLHWGTIYNLKMQKCALSEHIVNVLKDVNWLTLPKTVRTQAFTALTGLYILHILDILHLLHIQDRQSVS